MGEITVSIAPATPIARTSGDRTACIIGRSTGYVGDPIIENVTNLAALEGEIGSNVADAALEASINAFLTAKTYNVGFTVALFNAVEVNNIDKAPVNETWGKTTYTYSTTQSPVDGVSNMYLLMGTAYVTQPAAAWEASSANDIYTGEIVFDPTVGDSPWSYDGVTYIDPDDITDTNLYHVDDDTSVRIRGVYADVTLGRFQALLAEMLDKDMNIFAFSYDTADIEPYSGSTLLKDYLAAMYHCAAAESGDRPRQFVGALPNGVKPTDLDTGYGLGIAWELWKDIIGSDNVTLIQHDVSTDPDTGIALSDPAAFFMGKYVSKEVIKEGFELDPWGSFSQVNFPSTVQRKKWDEAQICTIYVDPAAFSVKLFSPAYTLGVYPYDRVEAKRAIYWVQKNLVAALKTLKASHRAYTNLRGMNLVKRTIDGVVGRAVTEGVCDGYTTSTDYQPLVFPLRDAYMNRGDTNSEALITTYKTDRSTGPITVNLEFNGNIETMTITIGFR